MNLALIITGIVVMIAGFGPLIYDAIRGDYTTKTWPLVAPIFAGFAIGIALIVVGGIRMDRDEKADCLAAGGAWVFSHRTTTYIKSGNVLVPIQSDQYRCDTDG